MIKILVVGDPGVGKSTLIDQISENISASPLSEEKDSSGKFRLCRTFNTRFGLFEVSTLEGHPEDVLVQQKNIDGILFVYDNVCSFSDLSEWIQTSKNILSLTTPRFLVCNKKKSFVKNLDFQETSSTLHSFEVNALDKIEVQSLFSKLFQEINKNTDEEMAKLKSDNERLFQEKIYHEISAIKKENKEIIEKMNKIANENIFTEFQSKAQKVLGEFRTEGKALIKETQEFLVQLQSYSKENTMPRMKSATSLPAIELQDTAQLPSILLNKSKSVHQINELGKENIIIPNRQHDMGKEIRLIWDTINTIIGNTHDHLEKIRHEINRINNRKQFDENYQIKSKNSFLEKEMPHIITKIKDQVHNYIIGVQKEFEDKIITLEDNFLNTEKKKTFEEEEEIHLVENPNNLEEMIQSFQSPFLRMRKDEFAEKTKPKQSSLQLDFDVLKEESLPSLWATLDLVAIRLNRLEHKIIC